MKLNKLYIAILLFAGILTSCKVGKSYVRPDLHLPDSLAQHQDTVSFGDKDWEEIYTDSTLRSLIDRALDHNKDMLIAAARIKEMAAQKRISTAALLPDIKGKVTAERELENHGGDAFKKSETFEALGKSAMGAFGQYCRIFAVGRGATCTSDDDCGGSGTGLL